MNIPKHIQKSVDTVEQAYLTHDVSGVRDKLRSKIEFIVNDYLSYCSRKGISITKQELERASWKYLDFAIHTYLRRYSMYKKELEGFYTFEDYYTWYARQGIVEILHRKTKKGK